MPRIFTGLCLRIVVLSLGVITPVSASGSPERRWIGWQFQGENDAIALFSGSDEHYTNGLRFAMIRNPGENPGWVDRLGERFCTRFCGDDPTDTVFGWSFGQNVYTPDDISIAALIADDRPYAAVLYGSLFVQFLNDKETRKQTLELQLGFVGPEAGGEFVQRELHELIDDEPPLGWDNQLGFEPIINLNYGHERRRILVGDRDSGVASLDVVPHWGFGVGNLMTRASAGATLRAGKNVSGFPQADIVNTFGGGGAREGRSDFEGYVFVGVEGRAVLHNLLLDGNTFKDSHEVDKRLGVYDLRAGFFLRWRNWQFNYTFVRRSQEFNPARGENDGRHDFGSFTLSKVLPLRRSG